MTPNKKRDGFNKKRDELADEYARLSEPELTQLFMKQDFKNGYDAAEKQYLGEIEELKAILGAYRKENQSLKADLEWVINELQRLKWDALEPTKCPDGIENCGVSHRKKTPIYFSIKYILSNLESKLGGE